MESILYRKCDEPSLREMLTVLGFLQPFETEYPVDDVWELCQDLDEKTQQAGACILIVTADSVRLEW